MADDIIAIEMLNRYPGSISLQKLGFLVFLILVIFAIISHLLNTLIPFFIGLGLVMIGIIVIFVKLLETV